MTTALNIVCFPETMDLNILGEILAGGSEKVRESEESWPGGHSIADEGIKYGLSVCGTVSPGADVSESYCREGDALLLTKPLGVGLSAPPAGCMRLPGIPLIWLSLHADPEPEGL